jgi:hypothetical protein
MGVVILAHFLLLFIGVIEDNDIAIAGWPNQSTIEVIEELLDDLLVP